MSAEPIARVVADIRSGRAQHHVPDGHVNGIALERAQRPQPVVDATAIALDLHERLVVKQKCVDVYGDHPSIAPPWDEAMICWVNSHGNVVVAQMHAGPWPRVSPLGIRTGEAPFGLPKGDRAPGSPNWQVTWETPNNIDWGRLHWLVETFLWVGGRNSTGDIPTTGPVHLTQFAIYEDGEPADLHYVQLVPDTPLDTWEVPQLVLLASLNLLNCRNVTIAEPQRPRPVRRRLFRTGVQVQAIVVRPIGRRSGSRGDVFLGDERYTGPVSPVRGSFHHYGPQYDKGLLFGKIAGRFWVPAHVRGVANGEAAEPREYLLKP